MLEITARPPVPAFPGYACHVAEIRAGSTVRELELVLPEDVHPRSEDWLVPPAMFVGMAEGHDVRVRGRVSPRILASVDRLQEIIRLHHHVHRLGAASYREPSQVLVEADRVVETPPLEEGHTVSAFSCGLDSFYTAMELDEELDGLLYVHGCETRRDDHAQLLRLLPAVKASAAGLGKRLLLVDGNFWELALEPIGRDMYTVLSALTMIGLAMSSHVSRLVLPASYDEHFESQEGSLSDFVPLWSTDAVQVEQHGVATRTAKARRIASSEVAMRNLRVCWQRHGVHFNCGRCHKCVRTRVNLELAGAAGRCQTLPALLDLELVATMSTKVAELETFVRESMEEAESIGRDDVAAALRTAMETPEIEPSKWAKRWGRLRTRLARRRAARALARHRRRHPGDHLFITCGPCP